MELGAGFNHMRIQPTWLLLLSSLGFLILSKFSISLLRWVYVYFLRPPKNLKNYYGSWALITGPTDGIGKALAFELARKGLNLVLVGRNPDKLKEVSKAINGEFTKVRIKTVVIDFSGDLMIGIRRLQEAIEGLEVGVVINNAGVSYPSTMFFHEVEEEMWREMIRVNVEGLTKVTQVVLPGMLQRRRGAIVNIGSGSSVAIPSFPLFAVYAATKAYVDQFSRSLNVEYKNSGIDVQCQVPMLVATKMIPDITSLSSRFLVVVSPDVYARAAVRWIGYEPRCTPYWAHSLLWCLCSLMPDSIVNALCLRINFTQRKTMKRL